MVHDSDLGYLKIKSIKMNLTELPRELLGLQLLNLTASEIYNIRNINRLYYDIYRNDNFWRLKFQHDHGFLPPATDSYHKLYYNYKRVYLYYTTDSSSLLAGRYIDLKNFAKRVHMTIANIFYFIDLNDNLWSAKIDEHGRVTTAKISTRKVVDFILGQYNREEDVFYVDNLGKVWHINNGAEILIYDDVSIKKLYSFYSDMLLITRDNQLVYLPYSEPSMDTHQLKKALRSINNRSGIHRLIDIFSNMIILDNQRKLWIINNNEDNNQLLPGKIKTIDDVVDVQPYNFQSVFLKEKLFTITYSGRILPLDENFVVSKIFPNLYLDNANNLYYISRDTFVPTALGYVVEQASSIYHSAELFIFTGSKLWVSRQPERIFREGQTKTIINI